MEIFIFGLNAHEMMLGFTDTLLYIFSKHITNKIVSCNDKDAPWITPEGKSAIRRNSRVYRKWVQRGRIPADHDKVCVIQNLTNKLIRKAKRSFYEKLGTKWSDLLIGNKNFWTTFKRITNKKKLKKYSTQFWQQYLCYKFSAKN